ncbi:MAG: ribbon-helix-helix protein, CopG family [Thermoprotei archaeon]|nr:ribbon-helix-helix protein, CopG family [Thermoprotei archaeon]
MAKRRFGVSISRDLADRLDELTKILDMDRSSLVEAALRSMIVEHAHYLVSHECSALIVLICSEETSISEVLMEFKDINITHLHDHKEARCNQIIIAAGQSTRIAKLYAKLNKVRKCRAKYVALHEEI